MSSKRNKATARTRAAGRRASTFSTSVLPSRHCKGCGRRYRGDGEWNVEVSGGRGIWILCPGCQTPEENAEAEINAATLDYARVTTPSGTLLLGRPRL